MQHTLFKIESSNQGTNGHFMIKIMSSTFKFTDITELLLARIVAFKNIASDDKEQKDKAKQFLLKTMIQSEKHYDFPTKEAFVKKIIHWNHPEIITSRCDDDLCAVVYKIAYKTDEADYTLHEISFFEKNNETGTYNYSHKYNLNELHETFCKTPNMNAKIRQIGDAVLHHEAETVIDFSNKNLLEQLHILKDTLTVTGGVGIAANQCASIDKPLKLILSGVDYNNPEHVIKAITRYPQALFPQMKICVNPVILNLSDERDSFPEGCLSAQGRFRALVLRPKTVSIRYQDLSGAYLEAELAGSDARVMLHELDHILNGKVYIQRIIDELSVSQCQILSAIIDDAIYNHNERESNTFNPFLSPIILFERTHEGVIQFNEEKVKSIFRDTKKNVLEGLNQELCKKMLQNSSRLGAMAKL